MAYNKAHENINWQNLPSEATALNAINLNKMDNSIDVIDDRVIALDTARIADEASLANKVDKVAGKGLSTNDYTDADKEIVDGVTTALAGKVDKEAGKGLSSNDYTTAEKNKLAGISANAKNVSISDTLADGTTLANITIDGTTTAIKGSDIEVDEELSPTSTNPVENKAIYDALNNLLPSKTVSGNPISISDASGFNAKALTVSMNPIQDLHGYSNPWAGGAGKNKLQNTATSATISGVTFTVNSDGSVRANGTASGNAVFILNSFVFDGTSVILNGCPTGGSSSTYKLDAFGTSGLSEDIGNGVTISTSGERNIRIVVFSGATIDKVFKPMIRLSTVTDYTFAPYSNICPISGRTEASVTRTGKNLCYQVLNGLLSTTAQSAIYYSNNDCRSLVFNCKKGVTYIASGVTSNRCIWGVFDSIPSSGTVASDFANLGNDLVAFTPTIDGVCILYVSNSPVDTSNAQIELGSTATAYEPYQAETYTHQYSETIYGGVDDFVNGELINEYGFVDLGTLNYTYASNLQAFYTDGVASTIKRTANDDKTPTWLYSSAYKQSSVNNTILGRSNGRISVASNGRVWISNFDYTDATAFKSALDGITLCYGLATPTTIQTSAEEITLLKGENVLSTNADDMELKYSVSLDSLLTT